MINYGTMEYYVSQIEKAKLQKELLEQAIGIRQKNGEIEIAEFVKYGEILAEAMFRIKIAEDDFSKHLEKEEQ